MILISIRQQFQFAQSGLQFMELNSLYQLLALQRSSPEILAAAETLLFMPDFLHYCLSGARVAEFTIATTSQCVNPKQRMWATDLLNKLGLPVESHGNSTGALNLD